MDNLHVTHVREICDYVYDAETGEKHLAKKDIVTCWSNGAATLRTELTKWLKEMWQT